MKKMRIEKLNKLTNEELIARIAWADMKNYCRPSTSFQKLMIEETEKRGMIDEYGEFTDSHVETHDIFCNIADQPIRKTDYKKRVLKLTK